MTAGLTRHRPWNLVASANALAGIVYVHGPPIFTADPTTVPDENITYVPRTDDTHGSIKTYFVPTENLPLTQVFRDFGVPDALVDKADDVLRPVIDAGYVRHDQPGDTRPYLYDGEIHRNVQSQQQAREPLRVLSGKAAEAGQQRPAHRSELRQAIQTVRRDLRDRVEAGLGQLTKTIAAIRPAREPGT